MTAIIFKAVVLVTAYLVGSIPTALIISRRVKGVDIRSVGDGNMGAHNTFHEVGSRYGYMVAFIDFAKGVLPVLLAYTLGLSLGWQILAGILAILGHDFPIFAGFKGGQGTATSAGTMLVLFPLPTLTCLLIYGLAFLIIKNSNISFGLGGAAISLMLIFTHQWVLLAYATGVFLFIPLKLWIDNPRRKAIGATKLA